jgi:hypothetical protein
MATTQAPERTREEEMQAAATVGAETADMLIGHAAAHGLDADQVDAFTGQMLAGRFERPTEVSDAFYAAYEQRAADLTAGMRAEREADPGDIEAG